MTPFEEVKAYGDAAGPLTSGNAPSEIIVKGIKGGDQIIVSNRNATFFPAIRNPDPKNHTQIPSDSIASFNIPANGQGNFTFKRLSPAGGLYPRHFSLNRRGDLVAVGLQNSGRVAVFERCVETGAIGEDAVADFEGLGQVSSLVWDEKVRDKFPGY